ncbi:hypothetical protein [Pseudofulvibacter geojedonensis]|uniref:Response regulatory domain-containing protein n=1 Tax=Pseudofulvibacter geojedonensis TaxID=1123758 RepID=A0ABW3I5T9_9FLAO
MVANLQQILLIEKNPLLIALYQKLLSKYANKPYQLKIEDSITTANRLFKKGKEFDIVILSSEYNIQEASISEERFLTKLRFNYPKCKLFLISNSSNVNRIKRMLKLYALNVYLLQEELNQELLEKGFEVIWSSSGFLFSPKVKKIKEHSYQVLDLIDLIDVDLLFYLTKSCKTKDLPEKLNLSLGAIEKRKNRLKKKLETDNLLQAALENGLL